MITGDELARSTAPDLATALAGRCVSLSVLVRGGSPTVAPVLRIRGRPVNEDAAPLVVIDGVPVRALAVFADSLAQLDLDPLALLRAEDVETVRVVTGPAASLYGRGSAAGVIEVRTRRGGVGAPVFRLRTTGSTSRVGKGIPLQNEWGENDVTSSVPIAEGTPTFDHFGDLYRAGGSYGGSLDVSGGTDRTRYAAGIRRSGGKQILVGNNSGLDAQGAFVDVRHEWSNRIQFSGTLLYTEREGRFFPPGKILQQSLLLMPDVDIHDYRTNEGRQRWFGENWPLNPLWELHENLYGYQDAFWFGRIGLSYDLGPTSRLRYHEVHGRLGGEVERREVHDWGAERFADTSGSEHELRRVDRALSLEAALRANPTVIGTATLTIAQHRWKREGSLIHRFGIEGSDAWSGSEMNYQSRSHILSGTAQADLSIGRSLRLLSGLRYENDTEIEWDFEPHWSPMIAADWSPLATLGAGGNQLIVRAGWSRAIATPRQVWLVDYAGYPDFVPGFPTSEQAEVGIALSLLRDHVRMSASHHRTHTTGLLLWNPHRGNDASFEPTGENASRGWEISLSTRLLSTDAVSWELELLGSRHRDRISDLPVDHFIRGPHGRGWLAERYSRDVIFGRGLRRCDGSAGCPAGAIYLNENGFPIREESQFFDPTPDWSGGAATRLSIGRTLELSARVDGRRGGTLLNTTRGWLTAFGTHQDTRNRGTTATFGEHFDVPVGGPGAEVELPVERLYVASYYLHNTELFAEDGSFATLREISARYLPRKVNDRFGLRSLSIAVTGRNLLTWTAYTGVSPESILSGGHADSGDDRFNDPLSRSVALTIEMVR